MKGIILAGGIGSRLEKLTSVLNKHLVAVGKYPMIEYPLSTLRRLGVEEDIIVVTGSDHVGTIVQYLTKEHPRINFTYKVQKEARGIAQALGLVEGICKNEKIAVILGDNIFEQDFSEEAKYFEKLDNGAMFFFKEVSNPMRFGVPIIDKGRLIGIEEKPKQPRSNLAVTGLYFFDKQVFDFIKNLKPSERGEYEISDVNEQYIQQGRAMFKVISGFWSDAGTHESRKLAEDYVYGRNLIFFKE